ncbi:hypothetical protein GRI89_00175 [Altererythrobacter salegens]|uniref:Uncharacterized protein n=1 Tax=Croceibacterium salegens TaxID=1737568 RepID=A0A6I4SQ37_9SPHN|nr:hypothetical protein [Croceibacterium salegens]MXO57963.1 hypothetical protein [Croceibacterium salegens]
MKILLAFATLVLAAPLAAQPLAGVSDDETVIRAGVIKEFHRGNGDVMFVRDRENNWFRLGLNDGCLRGFDYISQAYFEADVNGQIDKSSTIKVSNGTLRTCAINSIRKSVAPPQVDSHSPITLD